MANGSLSNAWAPFDDATRLGLAITELDRIYFRLDQLAEAATRENRADRDELSKRIDAVRVESRERIESLRSETEEHVMALKNDAAEWKKESQAAMRRLTGVGLGLLGGIITGLVLLVAQVVTSR